MKMNERKTKTLKESLKSITIEEMQDGLWMFVSDAADKYNTTKQSILNLIRKNRKNPDVCEGRVLRMKKSGNDGPIVVRLDPRIYDKKRK